MDIMSWLPPACILLMESMSVYFAACGSFTVLVTVVIGLLVGLLAVALSRLTEGIITYKNTLLRLVIHSTDHLGTGVMLATLLHVAYSVILVTLASGLVSEAALLKHVKPSSKLPASVE